MEILEQSPLVCLTVLASKIALKRKYAGSFCIGYCLLQEVMHIMQLNHIAGSVCTSLQITEANFFTVCYGKWPWEELHLTSDHLRLVQTWVKGLEALIEACRSDGLTKHNAHGSVYMLQCCYLKLFRKHGDCLSPIDALKEFAQVKQWKAKQV